MDSRHSMLQMHKQFPTNCLNSIVFRVWNSGVLFCFLAASTNAASGNTGASGTDRNGQCRDTDPPYQCTDLGEISGKMVIKGSFEQCSTEELSNSSGSRRESSNLILHQFQVSRPSNITVDTDGVMSVSIHMGTSLDAPALARGTVVNAELAPGTYTLVKEVPQCVDISSDKDERHQIVILTSTNGEVSDADLENTKDQRGEDEKEKRSARFLATTLLGTSALLIAVGVIIVLMLGARAMRVD